MKMFLPFVNNIIEKRLKIPKGSPEAANRKTGNAIANRKQTQGQAKDRQCNAMKQKTDTRTNNDLQNTTHNTLLNLLSICYSIYA